MSGLRVIPTWRHGQERLYVCLEDGRNIAWYDREAARINLLSADREDDVLEALGPFVTGPVTVGPPPGPPPPGQGPRGPHPGEALLVALDRDPGPSHRLRADPRRRALTAEQTVGEALDRLDGAGWHTLHSVPLPGGDRIHHLLLGPGGLFAVHSLYARKQKVTVADPMISLGRREPTPLLRHLRRNADRASHTLTAEVHPALALLAPTDVTITAPHLEIRILQHTDLPGLARLGGVLKPADVEALHAMARDRRVWAAAG